MPDLLTLVRVTAGPRRVLVLGATGMLGHTVLRVLAQDETVTVMGSARSMRATQGWPKHVVDGIRTGVDVENPDALTQLFRECRPEAVINCVGLVKQLSASSDPLAALPINALLPHRLARLCSLAGARLVHMSTDCVFSGAKGLYAESDIADATDLYGRSKHLGEVDYPNAVTLRTSIIGHELGSSHGLVEWFLSQTSSVKGFTHAIFSGLPTVELARVIRDRVLPDAALRGVYHVAADPISKFDLLTLVKATYGAATAIAPDDTLRIDRSLAGDRFRTATGYIAPPWPELIRRMHDFH